MNKTALTIEMLKLLYSHRNTPMKKQELAEALGTNVRNIREYKKELEAAGYNIESTKGPNGGLKLIVDNLFPVLKLTDKEAAALEESRELVDSHSGFKGREDYHKAMQKVLCSTRQQVKGVVTTYLDYNGHPVSVEELNMIETFSQAIENHLRVRMLYRKRGSSQAIEYLVEPYEIFHQDDSYYLAADKVGAPCSSGPWESFRMFRFSDKHMLKCELTSQRFSPYSDFSLKKILGENSMFRSGEMDLKLKVRTSQEHIFLEENWGKDLTKVGEEDDWAIYTCRRDEYIKLFNQLFEDRGSVRLVEPESLRRQFVTELETLLAYSEEEDSR